MKKRKAILSFFLLVFVVLVAVGRIQLWLAFFLSTLVLTPFFGRLYCGYVCPIGTLTEATRPMAKKKKWSIPKWLKHPVVRVLMLLLLVATMVLSTRAGKRLPILPILAGVGVVLSLFFDEALWHRYLCPYGTLLSWVSKLRKKGYEVESGACVGCGKCVGVCPADAITIDRKKASIDGAECLLCSSCAAVCPTEAISKA